MTFQSLEIQYINCFFRRIYFEDTQVGKTVRQSFIVQNNSPIRAGFSFKTMKYPVESWIDNGKSLIENLIMRKMKSHSPLGRYEYEKILLTI
jgi:hypothetical protein